MTTTLPEDCHYIPDFVPDPQQWYWDLLEEFFSLVPDKVVYGGRRVVASSFRTDEITEFTKIVTGDDRRQLRNRLWLPMTATLGGMIGHELEISPPDMALFNLYRDGRDGVGSHADQDAHFGPTVDDVVIATVSLGQPRTFQLERIDGTDDCEIVLEPGSLVVMRGTMQREWLHSIATDDSASARLSITYVWYQRDPRSRHSWSLMRLPDEVPSIDGDDVLDVIRQASSYDGQPGRPVFIGTLEETFARWLEIGDDGSRYAMSRGVDEIVTARSKMLARYPHLQPQGYEAPIDVNPDEIDLTGLSSELLIEMVSRAEAELERRQGPAS